MTIPGPTPGQVASAKIPIGAYVKADVAGAPSDAEFASLGITAADGYLVQNTVDNFTYRRSGGVWGLVLAQSNTAFQPAVYVIQQAGSSYTASPSSAFSPSLNPITNTSPDLAALVNSCWSQMTPLGIYGGIFIVPASNQYLWKSSISPLSGMSLWGTGATYYDSGSYGKGTVVQNNASLNAYALAWTSGTDTSVHTTSSDTHGYVNHFELHNLAWNGNAGNNSSGGVYNAWSKNAFFDNLEINNCKSDCILFNGEASFGFYNRVTNTKIGNTSAGGIKINNADENYFGNIIFNFVPTYCINSTSGFSKIIGCEFVSSGSTSLGSYAVELSGQGERVIGCDFDTTAGSIHVDGPGTPYYSRTVLEGNTMGGATGTAVYVSAAGKVLMVGNAWRNMNGNGVTGTGGAAVILDGCTEAQIAHNVMVDTQATHKMTYGVAEINGADSNWISDNYVVGFLNGEYSLSGATTKARFRRYDVIRPLYKAGAPVDGDFAVPVDGLVAVDSTNNKIWTRIGGVWKGVVVA